MAEDPRQRTLRIQTGIVRRLIRDIESYQREADQQESKVAQMEADGADSHDVAKQREVLAESTNLIPMCVTRLADGMPALQSALDEAEGVDGIDAAILAAAQEMMANAQAQVGEEEEN